MIVTVGGHDEVTLTQQWTKRWQKMYIIAPGQVK